MTTTTVKNSIEAIEEYLGEMSHSQIISAHNQCCENNNVYLSIIYENDEDFFKNHLSDSWQAIQAAHYGIYSINHKYVMFNASENLISDNDPFDMVEISDIANDIMNGNEHTYGIDLEYEEED